MKKSRLFGLIWLLCLLLTAALLAYFHSHQKEEKQQGKVFLFIGDSITDGNWGVKSHSKQRSYHDLNHIYGHGYVFLCAGEMMANYPEHKHIFHNRGISGNTIVDIKNRWQTDCLDLHPDVLSILVGINDICEYYRGGDSLAAHLSVTQFETNYRYLLESVQAQYPSVEILLMSPFVAPVGRYEPDYTTWRTLTQSYAEVVKQLAQDYRTQYIDMQALFDKAIAAHPDVPASYWIWDGIHPTAAGHTLMAKVWLAFFN